jgi:outer membrane protein
MEKKMLKKLLTTLLATSTFAVMANADFARVEAGAGVWNQEPKQTTALGTDTGNTEDDIYVWAYVKHPTPVIPNLRVEYSTATAKIVSGSTQEFTQIDVIPYYNLLDNTAWITLDLGLDIRSVSLDDEALNKTDDIVLPLGYVRTRVQLPLTGLGAEADVKYISYSDNTFYDARIKLDYTFDITPVIQPGIEVGYRIQKVETDELLNRTYNLEFSGLYIGAMLRF